MKKIIPVLVIMSITIPAFAGSDEDGDSTGLKIASVVAMLAVLLLAIRKLNGMKKD